MTKKTKDFFCNAVSDKDFIFGVFSIHGFYSGKNKLLEERNSGKYKTDYSGNQRKDDNLQSSEWGKSIDQADL